MLARTAFPTPQQPCSSSTVLRATPYALNHGRVRLYCLARSSSPRNESWRSTWRTELDHGSNGNGNGAHTHDADDYVTAYSSNGAGYHDDDTEQAGWDSRYAADEEQPQHPESPEDDAYDQAHSHWYDRRQQPFPSSAWEDQTAEAAAEAGSADNGDADEAEEAGSSGFFTDAFKNALKDALKRSPLYADEYVNNGSGGEENVEPEPHESRMEAVDQPIFTDKFRQALKESLASQQAQADQYGGYGSDDEDPPVTAVPYVSPPPARREMSPLEEVLATALGASQLHLRRLNLMKNEIEAAIERETKQMERLDFALRKAETDRAYFSSLEKMIQEKGQRE